MESARQMPESYDVKVKLLLNGGHQYTLWLKSDAPLLENLLKVLVARSQNQAVSTLFQLPIDEGHSGLCFPSEYLIGVETSPPIFVQQQGRSRNESAIAPTSAPSRTAVGPASPRANILPSDCVQIDNFLTSEQQKRLIDYVLQQESAFLPTTTSTGAADYRRSWVLHSFPEFASLTSERIQAVIPDVFSKLSIQPFSISQIEAQLTAHNDGNYYKIHNDSGSADTATRVLTYVYYFYREPKPFTGGELLIYDSKVENNFYVKAESFKTVEPRNNSIVFFLSRYMHEVLPVSCPSQSFADSRFTINGWIRR